MLLKGVFSVFQVAIEDVSAVDKLSADFVAPTKASGVQAPAPPSNKKAPEVKLLCVCVCVCVSVQYFVFFSKRVLLKIANLAFSAMCTCACIAFELCLEQLEEQTAESIVNTECNHLQTLTTARSGIIYTQHLPGKLSSHSSVFLQSNSPSVSSYIQQLI